MTASAALTQVETAVGQGDETAALRHALVAWQHCRHERITALIERLSSKVSRSRARPGGKGVADKQTSWLALAAANDPADLEVLLGTLTDVRKGELLEARLATLKGRIDPRIAKAMHAVLEDPPISSSAGVNTLLAALELVVAIADPRSGEAWSRLVRIVGNYGGGPATEGLRKKMPSGSTRLHAALDEILTELSEEDTARLDAIEALLTPARAQSVGPLFAAVYANPEDDRPRMVLADLLQELGDPRGELIALQLARSGKRSKREKELLDAHAHDWLGPIAVLVHRTDLDYERGFVARCSMRGDSPRDVGALVGRPEWRTMTDVDIRSWDRHPGPLLEGMPSLRVLRGVADPSKLPAHDRIERVQTGVVSSPDELAPLAALPALRSLEIDGCWRDFDEFDAFWKSPTIPRLREFSIMAPVGWLVPLFGLGIPRIGYVPGHHSKWRLWIEDAVVTAEQLSSNLYGHELPQLLALIPEPSRRRVVIDGKGRLDTQSQAALKAFSDFTIKP